MSEDARSREAQEWLALDSLNQARFTQELAAGRGQKAGSRRGLRALAGRLIRRVRWLVLRTLRFGPMTLLVVAGVAVIVGLLWPLTDLIAAHDVGLIAGPQRALHLQAAREVVRGQMLTLGAGVFAAGALVFTARNFRLSRRTYELTEQGQVTDRYTKAIEQLGSDTLDVRIGGIYALERIARDSARDHPTVMEVLAAFIREHSAEPWLPSAAPHQVIPDDGSGHATRPDVQAAVTAIGRRHRSYDNRVIDLTGADLTLADLFGAHLMSVKLTDVNFTGANLFAAHLIGTQLQGADFSRADLKHVEFVGAFLDGAHFNGALLWFADFTKASLYHADFTGAELADVNFSGARLASNDPVPEGWEHDPRGMGLRKLVRPEPGGAP
jgi:hypothetical protein